MKPAESDSSASTPHAADASIVEPAEAGRPGAPSIPTPSGEPFWNSKGFIAALALIGAAVPPMMTWITKDAELRLAESEHRHTQALAAQEQRHKIRMDYFSRAIDPANDAEYRERVLRFLGRSEDDPALREWAREELDVVAPQAAERRTQHASLRAELGELESQVAAERAQRERVEGELAEARAPQQADARRLACTTARNRCEAVCRNDTTCLVECTIEGARCRSLAITADQGGLVPPQ